MAKYPFSFSGLVKSSQYLTDPKRYIIAFYCLHNDFSLVFIIEVFITKVTVKENSFENFKEMSCYNVESLENLYFKSYAIHLITSAKKRDNFNFSNFILCSLLGDNSRIYFMLSISNLN